MDNIVPIPMTLEHIRQTLQDAINEKNEQTARNCLAVLEAMRIPVNYIERSEDEIIEKKKLIAKEMLTTMGMSRLQASDTISKYNFRSNESVEDYAQRLFQIFNSV